MKIPTALDENQSTEVTLFCTDFSKKIYRVALYELIQKIAKIGVEGYQLKILINYLENRKQFVTVDTTSLKTLDITTGVPQQKLLGPPLFCIIISDLPEFSVPNLFADDLKVLFTCKSYWQVRDDRMLSKPG